MRKGKLIGKIFGIALVVVMVASTLGGMFTGTVYASDSDVHDNYGSAASETNNLEPCVPCGQSNLNLSEDSTNTDSSTKPVIVNIQVDLEKEGDQDYVYDILDQIESRNWRTTVFVTGEFAAAHPGIIRSIESRGHQIAVHGWQEGEDLTLLNYADQLSLIGRAFAAVRGPVSKPEEVVDFKPQGYKFNDDTIRIAQELGAKSVSGIFTCQEPFCKCPYAQKLGKITFPYPVTNNFWLVPISDVKIDSRDMPLDDEYINNPQEFLDYLMRKYSEQLQTKDPLIIAIHPSITGADGAKLNALSQFVEYVTNNNGRIKPLSSLTHLTTYIPSLQITSAPQSASPGETVTITVQFGAAIYCPSYYFRIYGKYPSESYWTLRAEHYHGVQTGTFSFSRSFTIPEPPSGDSSYAIRVVGQGCSGTCWPTPYSYEKMDEIGIAVQPELPPEEWSFAIITDLHIGHSYPDGDYGSRGIGVYPEGDVLDEVSPGQNYYLTDRLRGAVDEINKQKDKIKFAVVLGDIADSGECSELRKAKSLLDELEMPYFPVIGNHDVWAYTDSTDDPEARYFKEIFGTGFRSNQEQESPEFDVSEFEPYGDLQNYAFSYKGMTFIILDCVSREHAGEVPGGSTFHGAGPDAVLHTSTLAWLMVCLDGAKARNEPVVIFSHHPFVINAANGFGLTEAYLIRDTIADSGVNVLASFAGHIHGGLGVPDWVPWELRSMDANKQYPALPLYPGFVNFPVVTTEALFVAKNENQEKPEGTKGIIRVVDVQQGATGPNLLHFDATTASYEVPALNPSFCYSPKHLSLTLGPVWPVELKASAFTKLIDSTNLYYHWTVEDNWGHMRQGDGAEWSFTPLAIGEHYVTLEVQGTESVRDARIVVTEDYIPPWYLLINPDPQLRAVLTETGEDVSEAPQNTPEWVTIVREGSEERPIAGLRVHFEEATADIHLSGLTADIDPVAMKSVIHMGSWPAEIEESKILFIPSTGVGTVYICPNATSLDEVTPDDPNKVVINVGETVNGMTATTTYYNGEEYYMVFGVTGTGGGEATWIERPDLALSASDILFSNNNPVLGENVTISATIHNIGEANAESVSVAFYDGEPETGTIIGWDTINVQAGGAAEASVLWSACTLGSHEIYAIAQVGGFPSDKSYTNNIAHRTIDVRETTITGTVIDNNGNPATDVYIYAIGPTTTSTITDINGSYNITGLQSGSYTIRVEPLSPNLMLTSTSVVIDAGQTMIRNFTLQTVGSIAGNISDADGTPIANVSLYLSGYETARYRTDDSGHYVIPRLQTGTYTVNVDASETVFTDASATVSVVLGQTTTLDFILPVFEGGQIAGRVTDEDGNGVYNAYVSVSGPSWSSGYTNATGYYFIPRLLAGYYTVSASPPYGVNLVPSSTTAEVVQGETTSVDFALQPGGIISGRVTDENGEGISWAYVYADGPCYRSTYTDEDGYYTIFGLPSGEYTVYAEPPYGVNLIRSSTMAEVIQGETTIVNFILQVGGMITGRVTDEEEVGVSDAYVYASGPGYEGGYADEDGYYTISGLSSGIYTVTAEAPYGINLIRSSTAAEVIQGETTIVNFVLQVGGMITGRVTDEADVGVSDAYIYADGPGYGYGYADENGYYSITGLQGGTYIVTARPPYGVNLVPSSTTAEVIQGETTVVNFILQVGGMITGRVTDEVDVGVFNARIYASGPGYGYGYTDEEGYYTIFGLPSSTYMVEAYPPYGVNLIHSSTTAEVIQGETTIVNFVLQAGGIVTGRVTDEADVGVSDAYVYADGPGYEGGYTDEDGYYTISGLSSGIYTVTAEPPYGVNLVPGSTTAEVIQGETTIVNFVLQVGGIITGRVTDEADVGVFDARIYASGPGYGHGHADDEGYYTIFGLPTGTYIVEAYPPYGVNLVSDFTTAEVVQGETTTVDFVLQVGGIITGRVTDEAGVGVFDVYIYASGPGYGYGYTDEEGYYSIAGLQAGTHTIYIDAIGYGSWYIFVDGAYATYDTCVTVGVTLEQTTFVDFSQQPPNQAPVANAGPAQTVCIIPPASTAMVTLDGSGSYDADGDPLTYNWTWDGNTAYGVSPTVELLTGTTTINLVVNDGKVDSEPDTVDITVQIPATIDFVPDALNLEAKGKYVTAYIELPPGYDVSQIDVSSIRLNDNVPALGKPVEIGDYDNDGLPDLMVKFHRTMVQDALAVDEEVGVTITGEVNEIIFEGGDAIRVITAAAAHGRGEWTRVSTPTIEGWVLAPNSVIVDYAVADDGDVAYAIVYSYDTSQFHLLKSTDGAATWEDIMGALEEEADGDINWLVAVATDAEDADFVAVALEMTDISVHVFISDDGGATFEDAGEVEDGGVYFPDGYYVSDLEVSPEVDGERDIAIGGMDWSGALLFRSTVTGDSAGAWEDTTDYLGDYPGWDDDGAFDSELVTDIVFCPSWAADKTILVVTATDTAVYLQSGTWGTSEGWNADSILAIDAVPILENIDIPMWLADFDAKAIAGITVPMDYSGRNSNSRYAWVWVNYYDEYDCPIGEIMRVKNKSVMEVNQQIEDLPWLTNVSYQGTIAEGEAIAGLLGTGTYDPVYGSPEDLIAACCEGVQVYRNDNIYNMDICCVPWEEACKPPTGTFATEAFYVGEDKAYAVSLWGFFLPYDEDAWSVSIDDGDNWNQLSLVDTHIAYLSDVAVSPDCNKTMLVSVNDGNGCGCDSVWLKAENLPEAIEYSGKWLRTWYGELENNYGLLRLTPEETTGDTVYLFDYNTDNVYWNEVEGLACWDFGSASVDDIVDLAVLDKETIYALDYNGDVAMSDDFAIGWQEEVDSEVANGYTIAVWGDYVLVGGEDGDVSYSDDGGETFTELEDVATSGFVTVAFDSYFDANDTIYAAIAGFEGSSPTTGGIYRWVIGESDEWENLDTENYAYTGLALNIPSGGKPKTSADTGGVLYASYVNGDTTGVARCLTPAEDVCCSGTDWDYLTRGLTSELFKMTPQALKICSCLTLDIGSRLFAIDGSEPYDMEEGKTGTVWSFED